MQTDSKTEKYLAPRQVAERYGVTRDTLKRWGSNEGFPAPIIMPGGHRRWSLRDLEAFEAERRGG